MDIYCVEDPPEIIGPFSSFEEAREYAEKHGGNAVAKPDDAQINFRPPVED